MLVTILFVAGMTGWVIGMQLANKKLCFSRMSKLVSDLDSPNMEVRKKAYKKAMLPTPHKRRS